MQTRVLAIPGCELSFRSRKIMSRDGRPSSVVNISGRLQVQGDEDVVIAGFIITGNTPRKILVRRLGPVPHAMRSLPHCGCGFGQRFDIRDLTAWNAISGNKLVTKSDFQFSSPALI